MTRAWPLAIAIAACSSSKEPEQRPVLAAPSDAAAGVQLDAAKQEFAVVKDGIPADDGWVRAVTIATNSWTESFNRIGVTSAKVSPVTSPDGAMTSYLLRVEASKDGKIVFSGIGLVSKGSMINGGGKPRLQTHLAALKFPKTTKLSVGHLVELVSVTAAIDRAWLWPPSVHGWDFEQRQGVTKHVPATLVYDDKGALLTLYRDGKAAETLERLEVRFDDHALITTTAGRQVSGSMTWERFTE